jgi:hypothetical protein
MFANTRVSRHLLTDTIVETTKPQLQQRLLAIVDPLDPILAPTFQPNPAAATVRPQIAKLQSAITALAWIGYQNGENLLVNNDSWTTASAHPEAQGHTSEVHIRDKENDIARLLWDYRNLPGGTPVNGTHEEQHEMQAQCIARYGKLEYPTYTDYIQLFWNAQTIFPQQQLQVAKTDITRGYHRLQWTPEGSMLLAVRLTDDLIMVPITLGFGKKESPYAFGPISDLLDHAHEIRLQQYLQQTHHPRADVKPVLALSRTYVDDAATFGTAEYLATEIPAADAQTRRTIYDGAVNPHKHVISEREDVLGIRTDTTTARAGISHKGYQKLVYLYFAVLPPSMTASTKLSLKTVQAMASLAHHYGKLIPLLRHTAAVY